MTTHKRCSGRALCATRRLLNMSENLLSAARLVRVPVSPAAFCLKILGKDPHGSCKFQLSQTEEVCLQEMFELRGNSVGVCLILRPSGVPSCRHVLELSDIMSWPSHGALGSCSLLFAAEAVRRF